MISKKKTRDALKSYIFKNEKARVGSKDWTISGFRHAIFNTVDMCKSIIGCRYEMNIEEKTTTCYLFFKSSTAKCIYNVTENNIFVEQIETVEVDGEDKDVVVKSYKCSCDELSGVVRQIQPKIKLVVKRGK